VPLLPWYLYLLECADGTLYAGVARDSPALGKSEAHRLERWLKRQPRARKLVALLAVRSTETKPAARRSRSGR
jgi:predicted GIY-YIG superfamily endonuclease